MKQKDVRELVNQTTLVHNLLESMDCEIANLLLHQLMWAPSFFKQ